MTPVDATNDEDSEDKDKEEADIEPVSDNPDPVQVVITKLRKSAMRGMIYKKNSITCFSVRPEEA